MTTNNTPDARQKHKASDSGNLALKSLLEEGSAPMGIQTPQQEGDARKDGPRGRPCIVGPQGPVAEADYDPAKHILAFPDSWGLADIEAFHAAQAQEAGQYDLAIIDAHAAAVGA